MRIPKLTDLIHSPGFDLDRNRGAERRRPRARVAAPEGSPTIRLSEGLQLRAIQCLIVPASPTSTRNRPLGIAEIHGSIGDTHGQVSHHFGPAFPGSAGLSQTGCVNAPLQAISQASSRTQVFPAGRRGVSAPFLRTNRCRTGRPAGAKPSSNQGTNPTPPRAGPGARSSLASGG